MLDNILNHPVYQQELLAIQNAETSRIYCKHTLEHFLDVARLMWIEALENSLNFTKDVIYATALLHDIGRNYNNHHLKSAQIATIILTDCHFNAQDIALITNAILNHRTKNCADILSALLYKCDKKSRLCFICSANATCNWADDKKNKTIYS